MKLDNILVIMAIAIFVLGIVSFITSIRIADIRDELTQVPHKVCEQKRVDCFYNSETLEGYSNCILLEARGNNLWGFSPTYVHTRYGEDIQKTLIWEVCKYE